MLSDATRRASLGGRGHDGDDTEAVCPRASIRRYPERDLDACPRPVSILITDTDLVLRPAVGRVMSITYVSAQTISGLVIDRGSGLQVQAGGTIVDTTFDGGIGFGGGGAFAVGVSVNSGGFFDLQSGSFGSGIVVNNGGLAGADFGGSAADITVNNGGTLSIDTSGTASDVLVNSGGTFVLGAGGMLPT